MARRNTEAVGQRGFDAFEPPRATDRLFFAVHPDAATAARIAQLAASLRTRLGLRGAPLQAHHLHVTLHHLGDFAGVPYDVVAGARAAAEAVSTAPFEIGFDHAASFASSRGMRPFVLQARGGLDGIHALRGDLARALAARGLAGTTSRTFTPHLTLLYDEALVPPVDVEPAVWRVESFALVHSLLGRTQHIELGRWPLHG